MKLSQQYDVIIIGGSYAGLAAGMALGRASKSVLIIDNGKACNSQTPFSHNFITQDGKSPAEIAAIAKHQVNRYATVNFLEGLAKNGKRTTRGFEIETAAGEIFLSKKLIFATGLIDLLPPIEGFAACWGISVLHCPYCHGYEVKNVTTGILENGDSGYDLARLISNWTKDLTLFTNGPSTLTSNQTMKLKEHRIKISEEDITKMVHTDGKLQNIVYKDDSKSDVQAIYAHVPFEQHCKIPETLGCVVTEEGYIHVDPFQETSVEGIYACGDSTNRMRTLANAIASGTTAGMAASKKMILEEF